MEVVLQLIVTVMCTGVGFTSGYLLGRLHAIDDYVIREDEEDDQEDESGYQMP